MVAASGRLEPSTPTVAIVGLGPKGLYSLERLVAEFCAHPLEAGLRVAVFNRSGYFGASPVYNPEQPDYILLNTGTGKIDLWGVDDPPMAAGRGPDFSSWYQEEFAPQAPLTGDEYLPRAVVGRYLHHGFRRIISHLPSGMEVSCFVGEVVDIVSNGTGYALSHVDSTGLIHEMPVDKILLATGHSQVRPGAEECGYQRFATQHRQASFIPFVYPVVATLSEIPAGARVAMKGIGLTFIDAVLALTEGRGGVFERTPDGCLSYRVSGHEPQAIIPFSRTGLPMTPKPHDLSSALRPLTFVTPHRLAGIRRRSREGKIDLEADVWPLVELEMELEYYRVAMGDGSERSELEACDGDAEAMERVIHSFLRSHPGQERFDYRSVVDPVGGWHVGGGPGFHSFVELYMEQEIVRARLGLSRSAVKAAISIWREVRSALSPFVRFGGLTPESHRRLMEQYFPLLKRVVFGPPIVGVEKLLALQRAGILDFSAARNPRVCTDEFNGCFELRCESISGESIPGAASRAEILVDARYPRVDILRDVTPLYRNLRRRGMIRAFENRSAVEYVPAYRPGAIDVTEEMRFVVDEGGSSNQDIAVIGIPTEGNLVGNRSVTRDAYAGTWAATVLRQLRCREHLRQGSGRT
ncbi:MAG: FAD/NAD(P)-binding protein [Pseudonocardiaceae bacterium]